MLRSTAIDIIIHIANPKIRNLTKTGINKQNKINNKSDIRHISNINELESKFNLHKLSN